MIEINTKIKCFIKFEKDKVFIYLVIADTIIQFADITEKFNAFIEINNQFELYNNKEDLINDLESGQIEKFLGKLNEKNNLNLISNLYMKMMHNNKNCGNDCILCNPNLGEDPFPDFTFDLKTAEPKGRA